MSSIHDMGPELDDGLVRKDALGAEFRTQPVWGLSAVFLMSLGGRSGRSILGTSATTFLGQSGPHVALIDDSTVTMVGNLVTGNNTTSSEDFLTFMSTVTASYGVWYDNLGGNGSVVGATDLVGVDPLLAGVGGACSWDRIRPLAGSPLIDGDPTLLDLDGTPADIGATGGPHAP